MYKVQEKEKRNPSAKVENLPNQPLPLYHVATTNIKHKLLL